ncbi:glutamate racemase [Avibacterium sp. 21-595]|uniref:glutamate racemase n=1 Tax=Avibacterium sp. 21-595 TaxID=2911527 RepID=UPI0020261F21|nr:glutamate racemase [Avibacterium sp. 21-595]URL06316.1 glutamate racemase [Avibacterium sp. 21-595]
MTTLSDPPTILFFDSGIGGLSVYREVKTLLPYCHYLYCLDNAFFPYSEKEEQAIIERCVSICQKISQQHPIDLIVIACNTASTVVLPALRENFSCPVVGTVPAVKPAAQQTETGIIGLLATKGTVKRPYVDKLIQDYAMHCTVEKLGSTELVKMAEEKLQGNPIDPIKLLFEVKEWQRNLSLDTVILGCTHFPFLKAELKACLPQVKYFLDPSKAIAKRVKDLLGEPTQKIVKQNLVYCTKESKEQPSLLKVFKQFGFSSLRTLILDK